MSRLVRFGVCSIVVLLLATGVQALGFMPIPSISSDGRYVAFDSSATDLVTGDTNGQEDVFLRDRQTGITTLISKK